MKVWELIKELEKMPAGSEVKVKQAFTEAEVKEAELKVTFLEEKHYVAVTKAREVALDREETAVIYCE